MNRFPSYLEHRGMYNVTPQEFQGEEIAAENDPTSYFQTVDHLPPLTWSEFQQVRSATYRALEEFARSQGKSDEETKSLFRYCVGDEIGDRTVRVELPEFSMLTPALVEGLQREVLVLRPLWRIMIPGESPETVVMIYPEAIRVGVVPVDGDWKAALPKLMTMLFDLREPTEGPQQRQLEYLRRKIPGEMGKLRKEPFRIVAVFDNYKGNPKEVSAWFLYSGEKEWFDFSLEEPESAASGERVALKASGTFDEYYIYDPDNQPSYWLKQWVLPSEFKGKMILKKTRPGPVVEGRWSIDFDQSLVIKDSDLVSKEKKEKEKGTQLDSNE